MNRYVVLTYLGPLCGDAAIAGAYSRLDSAKQLAEHIDAQLSGLEVEHGPEVAWLEVWHVDGSSVPERISRTETRIMPDTGLSLVQKNPISADVEGADEN